MNILKDISRIREFAGDYSGRIEEAVFVFKGVPGETLVRRAGFAGNAVKILAAFSENPVQSNFYEVFELEKMSNLIPRLAVKTAILCVPSADAENLAGLLIQCGISRILNWSGAHLVAQADTAILNEEPPGINNQKI